MNPNTRPDRYGEHRTAFDKNKKRILATQDLCGICGRPVDKSLKRPDPMAPEVDHIISVKQGGHPSDIANLQLTHAICNQRKGQRSVNDRAKEPQQAENIRWSFNWAEYRAKA